MVVAVAVLGVEVLLARRGAELVDPVELRGTVGDARPGARRVVWLGDSTAAGVGADEPGGTVPVRVAGGLGDVDLRVLARSGADVADVADVQAPAAAALVPDVVVVSVGANDVTHLTGRRAFTAAYDRLLDALPASTEVVLLGVPDMGAAPRLHQPLRALAGLRGRQLDTAVRGVARRAGATHVDIAGTTGPAFRAEPDRLFAADDYHPSDAGYRLWAEAVLEALPEGIRSP